MRRLPGTHPPNIKNRSSKHLGWLCGPGMKSSVRSMSNAALQEMAKQDKNGRTKCPEAEKELTRRRKKYNIKKADSNGDT